MIELIYMDKQLVTKRISIRTDAALLRKHKDSKKNIWVEITDPTMDELNFLGAIFDIHSLLIEDLYKVETNPKMEHHPDYDFFVLHGVTLKNSEVKIREIDFLLGKNFVISSHNPPIDTFENFRKHPDVIAKYLDRGSDFLFHHLVDMEVDFYFPVLEELDDRLERIAENIIEEPDPMQLDRLLKLKRQLITIRKYVTPQREIVSQLTKGSSPFVSRHATIYFRDLYDHMIRITDSIDSYREIVSGVMDVHLSVTSNKMNEIMKVLTIITTIMMPLTLITGLYGMNFDFMPELRWRYSYPVVILIMVLISLLMIRFFRKKGWI